MAFSRSKNAVGPTDDINPVTNVTVQNNTDMEHEGNERGGVENRTSLMSFAIGFTISQILGIACIVLVWVWTGHYLKGFAWQSNPGLEFNYHPLFMVIGLVFLYGDAILVYRVLRASQKTCLKLVHGGLHTLAFVFAVIALKSVFDSHNLVATPIPNLYSLHSWLGLATVLLFTLQFFFGFITFLVPGLSKSIRGRYLPVHVFFGVAIFAMSVASCVSGLTEKMLWSNLAPGNPYQNRIPPATLVNSLGLCLVAFGTVVAYLVISPQYKRKPLPEEAALDLTAHQFN